jgi:hypothetical protein
MFVFIPGRHPALIIAAVLSGISAGACSKPPDRPRTETAASIVGQAVASETTAVGRDTPADTAAATDTGAAVRNNTSTAAPPTPAKPPVRPSIDPGRKPTGRVTVPRVEPKPPADSASAPAPSQSGAGPSAAGDQWLKYDPASRTVTFELIAGPFNFNGYTSGGATLVVPAKANVVINFVNKDGTPHSAEIISGEGPLPNAAVDPAIPRAYTNKLLEGLPQEGTDVMRFTAPESGAYRIFCGVPGHGLSGMWIWMKVDPEAKTPSFGPTKA